MYSTHNFKLINSKVAQAPLCQQLTSLPPQHFISSRTVKISHYFWDESDPFSQNPELNEHNARYRATGFADPRLYRDTPLTDDQMHNMTIYTQDHVNGNFCSIIPAPCSGLFHEMILRDHRFSSPVLKTQVVERVPERAELHGAMVGVNRGRLASFALPPFQVYNHIERTRLDRKYVLVEFELDNFNIATGLVGVGLPSVGVFGLLLSNHLQRNTLSVGDVGFAIGIHNILPIVTGSNPDELPRKAKIQGYLVMECKYAQLDSLMMRLNADFKVSGTLMSYKKVLLTDQIPKAYWMVDLKSEVERYLRQQPGTDALDAAFRMNQTSLCVPVATGFALFDFPKPVPNMSHIRDKLAWAETLFSLTALEYGDFHHSCFYRRSYQNGVLSWGQE